jgi:cyclic pyranopterin monophosphate synthase
MVDVSGKPVTSRTAVASGFVRMAAATVAAIRENRTPKGDPLEVAKIAAIMAAKRTAELIPLCHPLPLNHVEVRFDVRDDGVAIEARAVTDSRTGVEMEALTAAAVAALTIYDMCKAIDKAMVITDIRLESKTGGTTGDFERMKDEG